MPTMRAVQVQGGFGIEALAITDLPEPAPGPGQVVVRVRAVSLNYRDLLVTKGLYSRKLPLPLTICSDCAGEVVAAGAGVTRLAPGDRVASIFMPGWIDGEVDETKARTALGAAAPGVLAEQVTFHEEALVKIPGHLSLEEAATLPCAALTAWHAVVEKGRVKSGDALLVLGSGGVSVFALQFARLAGARVIATSSSDKKLARLRDLGAAETINYATTPEWDEAARKAVSGGVDHVIEVGGAGTMNRSLRAVRMGGRVSLIGSLSGGAAEVNLMLCLMKSVAIQGIFVGSRRMFESMNRAITLHKLRPVVDRVFPMEDAGAALRHLESGAHFGKVCIRL